ncbi:MAG TPA: ATP-binding protein [Flavobacteriales bacterium]|nr:ATP-binding protein [Flavobacteriales bacterium]HPH81912.1 ATP-binding protein [Flavobacteriales bacterium]
MELVGRNKEIIRLNELFERNRSEFVVLYGRRRIGKTFLVRKMFQNRMSFQLTALANASLSNQLLNFHYSLVQTFGDSSSNKSPSNWLEAFQLLKQGLENLPEGKKLVFIDELPWLDTPRSGFLSAFEHFWNDWASNRNDVLLIVCGSAASWMIGKLLKNRGGLHNRVTERIHLKPFCLAECKAMIESMGLEWSLHQLLEMYQVLGGVPYYWSLLSKGKSATQLIDDLLLGGSALLRNEMQNLYASLFTNYQAHEAIVKALSTQKSGLNRDKLLQLSKLPNGGGTTQILEELEQSDFIRKYSPIGRKSRDSIYQLTDFFTLFHFSFLENSKKATPQSWMSYIDHPRHRAWSGYSFELLCLMHTDQIKRAMGISGIEVNVASWCAKGDKPIQIDLLMERRDQVINIFEMKFSIAPYSIDKSYQQELLTKIDTFRRETKTRSAVHLVLVSPYGLQANSYSGTIQLALTGEDLIK